MRCPSVAPTRFPFCMVGTMKKILTDRTLKSLKAAPKGKRYMVWDATVPSFGVRVTDRGRMTFVVMRRLNGKLLRRALGEYPITTLRAAREAASEALGQHFARRGP